MAEYIIPTIIKGDTFEDLNFSILINGVNVDLTNYEIACKFRKLSKCGEEIKSIEIGSGITLVNPLLGEFKIDEFNVNWPVSLYYYDIQFTDLDSGIIKTYIEGTFTVKQDVTY